MEPDSWNGVTVYDPVVIQALAAHNDYIKAGHRKAELVRTLNDDQMKLFSAGVKQMRELGFDV